MNRCQMSIIIHSHNPFHNLLSESSSGQAMRFLLSSSLKRSNLPTFQYSRITTLYTEEPFIYSEYCHFFFYVLHLTLE